MMVTTGLMAQAAGDSDVPIDLLRWLFALLPIVVLLLLLAWLRWKAPEAGPVGLLVTIVVAVILFEAPYETLVVAAGKGIWDAVPILVVIFGALLLFRIGSAAGALHALRVGIQSHSENQIFLVLAFGWVFATFTQGIAGFGAPIAIVAPILVALGVKPVYAVIMPLIGHAWGNFFGTVGIGWLATLQVVDVEDAQAYGLMTSLLLVIPILAGPLAIAWMLGRMPAVRHALPMVLIISVIMGGGQIGFVFLSPELSTFLASGLALIALYPLSRWKRYSKQSGVGELPAMTEEQDDEEGTKDPVMGLAYALAPYALLTVVAMIVLLVPAVESLLEQVSIAPAFPEVTTGFGVENEAEGNYEPFTPLTHAGGFLLISAGAAWLLYKLSGHFAAWREKSDPAPVWASTVAASVPATVAVITFLVLASVMSHTGQTEVLALGIADTSPPLVYAVLANFIGIIGALVTSSSTASNVLFCPLQDTVAASQGQSQAGILAAQSVGGAVGNVISPANIVLGTTTAGIAGKEGDVLRLAMVWAGAVGLVVGAATLLIV